jgi:hypothetical protein
MSALFDIVTPTLNFSAHADGQNKVLVRVLNRDCAVNTGFAAVIDPIGTGPGIFWTTLVQEGTTHHWSLPVDAAPVPESEPAQNNKTVTIWAMEGGTATDSKRANFKASFKKPAGSGSCRAASFRSAFAGSDQPVPVMLNLKLGSKVTKGTATNVKTVNKTTQLRYSTDQNQFEGWLSEPIDLGEKGKEPAFWMLKKKDSKTWVLVLQRKKTAIVKYRLKTKIARDHSFPIKLQLDGTPGKHFKKWPKTVTISPHK